MRVKVIKTEADYTRAMKRIDALIDAQPGTAQSEELALLAALVEMYEKKKHPMDPPTPLEAVRFRMEQSGLRSPHLNRPRRRG